MTAGYSGTPLQQKLGLKEGWRVAFVGGPGAFPSQFEGVEASASLRGRPDAIVLFVTTRAELEKRAPALRRSLPDHGMIWIAWPKKASGVATDLTEDVLREVLLDDELVDTKVCAVDDVWSGLRFVRRISARAGTPRRRPAARR